LKSHLFKQIYFSGEIAKPNDKVLVARGGIGGMRATQFRPARGQRKSLYLDLKLIADVGFVGLVNYTFFSRASFVA